MMNWARGYRARLPPDASRCSFLGAAFAMCEGEPVRVGPEPPMRYMASEVGPVEEEGDGDLENVQAEPRGLAKRRRVTRLPWPEQQEAERMKALNKWRLICEHLGPQTSGLMAKLEGQPEAKMMEAIQIVFAGKATGTLEARAGAMVMFIAWAKAREIPPFPLLEGVVLDYFRHIRDAGRGATAPQVLLEAIAFTGGLLELIPFPKEVLDSAMVKGAALMQWDRKRLTKEADPFEVIVLRRLEMGVKDVSLAKSDRIMCGNFCFATHARMRWDDAARISTEPVADIPADGQGQSFVEAAASTVKTGSRMNRRRKNLPVVADENGLTGQWGRVWLSLRQECRLDAGRQGVLFALPQPDGSFSAEKMTSTEAVQWLVGFLRQCGFSVKEASRYTSHSCKATILSWLAKAGAPRDDRDILGGHTTKRVTMSILYARDAYAAPMRYVRMVLGEVEEGRFLPDSTRSGRWAWGKPSLQYEQPMGPRRMCAFDSDSEGGSGTSALRTDSSEESEENEEQPEEQVAAAVEFALEGLATDLVAPDTAKDPELEFTPVVQMQTAKVHFFSPGTQLFWCHPKSKYNNVTYMIYDTAPGNALPRCKYCMHKINKAVE